MLTPKTKRDKRLCHSLWRAVQSGDLRGIERAVRQGADLSWRKPQTAYPKHFALEFTEHSVLEFFCWPRGKVENQKLRETSLKVILDLQSLYGADLNHGRWGPFNAAARGGNLGIMNCLIADAKKGGWLDMNYIPPASDIYAYPAVFYALVSNNSDMLRLVVAEGGDLNQVYRGDETILAESMYRGGLELELLIELGAYKMHPDDSLSMREQWECLSKKVTPKRLGDTEPTESKKRALDTLWSLLEARELKQLPLNTALKKSGPRI